NLPIAPGSASRTLVSSTYVRRSDPAPAWRLSATELACLDRLAVAEMATHTPLAPSGTALDTNMSDGPGPASERPAPALRSSRLRARTRSSRISRAFPPGGYAPPVSPDGTCEWAWCESSGALRVRRSRSDCLARHAELAWSQPIAFLTRPR